MDIPEKRPGNAAHGFATIAVILLAIAAGLQFGSAACLGVIAVGCIWAAWAIERDQS